MDNVVNVLEVWEQKRETIMRHRDDPRA
jgi:hypothetical protein